MTDPIERFTVESLLRPDLGARVLHQELVSADVHWHDYYELVLVLSGEAEHVVNGGPHLLRPGSGFLLSPADLHEIRSTGPAPLTCLNAVVDPGLMEEQLAALGPAALDSFPWLTDDFAVAEADLRRLRSELEQPRLGSRRVTEALTACLVVELARRSRVPDRRPLRAVGEDDLRAAVLFVDRHFREQITLAAAAAQAHLSPNYFSERFRDYTGTSFQLYLQERRLRFARSLLAATDVSVSEACHASGFNNISHFGRAFRRRYGMAPSARPAASNEVTRT